MTKKLDFEQRQQAERMAENGDQRDQCYELVAVRAEIERLTAKCAALAFLQYGSSGPDDPWQAKLDEVTKPLHAEIEKLRADVDRQAQLIMDFQSEEREREADEPSDGRIVKETE